jgi:hypothetical protein
MAMNSWNRNINIMDIHYVSELKILGTRFTTPINQAAKSNWDLVTGRIRALTRDAYYRDLCLAWRITYIHCYVLATAWYLAQIFPIQEEHIRQINSSLAYFLWKGEIFRVPISTLQREKGKGGWGLVDLEAKCRALFLCRATKLTKHEDQNRDGWLKIWKLHLEVANPPDIKAIPKNMDYLRTLKQDKAYIPPPDKKESWEAYRSRVCKTLQTLLRKTPQTPPMRTEIKWPQSNWEKIWRNLKDTPVNEENKVIWYKVINDIIPTRQRLHKI